MSDLEETVSELGGDMERVERASKAREGAIQRGEGFRAQSREWHMAAVEAMSEAVQVRGGREGEGGWGWATWQQWRSAVS